jgi:phosphohistidine phosphatase
MKTLYIVRHAKSSWDFSEISDKERPLLEKGKKRTKIINDYLINNKIQVDLLISSSAVRARETAKIIAKAIQYTEDRIRIEDFIYFADAERMFDIFYDVPAIIDSIMIVGHNPTVTSFANLFLENKIDWMPTSGVACIQFDVDKWEDAGTMNCKEVLFISPKLLKTGSPEDN